MMETVNNIVLMGYTCSGKKVFANKFLKKNITIDMRDLSFDIFKGRKNKSYSWRILRYIKKVANGIIPLTVIVASNTRSHRLRIFDVLGQNTELYYIKRDPLVCLEENGGHMEVLHEPLESEMFSKITVVDNENYNFNQKGV